MPPVKIKFVVSFTSQDENCKAVNLMSSDGFKKWLSNPKDKSGEISVTLQLENECVISFVDIGTQWCANIEIKVGRSDWPQDKEYETLAPSCIMMTPVDCNLGRNFSSTKMFSAKDFNQSVASRQWDRIRITCRQPLKKDVQFGLSFLSIKTSDNIKCAEESAVTGAPQKSIKSIQKHFFGKTKSSSESPVSLVKTKLLKMAGSTENGTEQEGAMSRTAKLVLAASAGNKPRENTPNKSPFYSDTIAQKYGPEFKDEVESFLSTLEIKEDELDRVTIADLRHKLEKKKRRKLEKEERKTFTEIARSYICKLFGESDDEDKSCDVNNCEIKENFGESKIQEKSEERVTTRLKQKCQPDNVKSDMFPPVNNNIATSELESTVKISMVDQLKQIRQQAHQMFKTKVEKTESSIHSYEENLTQQTCNDKLNQKTKNDNMSYLERKAFAFTNPYKVNQYGVSLSFGPCNSECNDEVMSPNKVSPSTNDQWLSKVNPSRNNVMFTPPSNRGKRKRDSVGTKGRKESKVSRILETDSAVMSGKTRSSRGRGKGKSAREIIPTSFERCPQCHESFPASQIFEHKMACVKDRTPSPDVVEVTEKFRSPEYVECPLCSGFYGSDVIQFHAAVCGDTGY